MNTLTAIGVAVAISLSAAVWKYGEVIDAKFEIVMAGLRR